MKLRFGSMIMLPSKLTDINNTAFDIKLFEGSSKEAKRINVTWNVTKIR